MKKLILTICLLAFIFNLSPIARAATSEEMLSDLKKQLSTIQPGECAKYLTPLFDAETKNFFTFLEANFQNKSSNSSLLNLAVTKYREYKENIFALLGQINPQSSVEHVTTTEQFAQYALCQDLANAYVLQAKNMMINHIKNTNYQKKATIFVEKYKALNDKLRELNFAVMKMYGFFLTFKNKLPFFVETCVTN